MRDHKDTSRNIVRGACFRRPEWVVNSRVECPLVPAGRIAFGPRAAATAAATVRRQRLNFVDESKLDAVPLPDNPRRRAQAVLTMAPYCGSDNMSWRAAERKPGGPTNTLFDPRPDRLLDPSASEMFSCLAVQFAVPKLTDVPCPGLGG